MKKLIALIAGATLLAGCHSDDTVKPEDLLHHRFVLVQANGTDIKVENDSQTPFISFGENFQVTGKMCNNFFGQAAFADGKLSSQGLASTKMLCPDDMLNKLDYSIGQAFLNGANVTKSNNRLTLKSGNDTFVYELKDLVN